MVKRSAHSDTFRSEKKLTLKQAIALPVFEERPQYDTLRRWCNFGVWGVRLQCRRQGKLIFTSREAVERFVEAMNG